ncbi:TetR/AcrR family transcriptional regulator [Lactiplantibacillus daowaiensis]|uniref:TetR/AcrR family transcriptional regulator n=1 Tax=Lactiplantibacillus daowaiensis TaxID=2559918 RepID=A0ABW1RYD7_9LACO|nr:TetR/AcrR family transcriptional regulator [Lactiplantibacillus daowaiensis]
MNELDLRVQKTRRTLRQTLTTLLAQLSFSKITVKQLCRESLINRVTFYKHYQDKNDLLYDLLTNLTIPSAQVPVKQLIKTPFSVFPRVVIDPLPSIIERQNNDIAFQWVYRQYFYNYYVEAFQLCTYDVGLPKELVSYTLVNNAFSFYNWQTDFNIDASEAELDMLFQKMFHFEIKS